MRVTFDAMLPTEERVRVTMTAGKGRPILRRALRCGLLLLLGACGLTVGGTASPEGSRESVHDASIDVSGGSIDGSIDGSADAVDAVNGDAEAASVADADVCSPMPTWANDCNGSIPCISTMKDSEKCVDRRAECAACTGKICCVVGDKTVSCVTKPALCVAH